ncbi:MAG: branched-chain amino acid ABC transporter permease [Geminicoccaceae bacterium]
MIGATRARQAALAAGALVLLGAAAIALIQALLSDYLVTLASIVLVYVMLSVSLQVTNGLTGLFSLGHPAFMTIGAYVAAILTYPTQRKGFMMPDLPAWLAGQQWDLLPALLAGAVAATLAAGFVGACVLRLKGHYLAVATLGLIIIVRVVINNQDGYTRGGLGLSGVARLTDLWWVYAWTVLAVYVAWRIKHASLGRAMLALRENEMAARCMGIDVFRMRLLAFVIGAFFAGIAGGLMVHLVSVITPGSYGIPLAFNLVVMVVIGGTGSITGAITAAIAISLLGEALKPLEETLELYGLSQVLIALGLIVVLRLRPQGLFGSSEPGLLRAAPQAAT